MSTLHLNDQNFDQHVANAELPVLVDFWAPSCAPCRAMGPVVDELSEDLDGKAVVVKVNVDEARETAGRFGISSIPTFAVFKNGEVQAQAAGAMPKERLLTVFGSHLN